MFFKLAVDIVLQCEIGKAKFDVNKLIARLVQFVKDRKPSERHHKDLDVPLNGILQMLAGLFERYPAKASEYGYDEKLISEILQNCLFDIPRRHDKKTIPGPKCKSHDTRTSAYNVLMELAKGSNENLTEIIKFVTPLHKNGKWRTKSYNNWNITPKENEKSSTGYVGLKNLGCSNLRKILVNILVCYMNSTIQQLYMIPSFRKAVLEVEDRALTTSPKEDNLLYQLKVNLELF